MGVVDYNKLESINRFLAPVFFFAFLILVYFCLTNMFISIVNRAYMVVHANMQLSDSLKKSKKVNKDSKDDIDNQKPKKLKTKLKMTVILERLEDFVKSTGMVVVQSEELLPILDDDEKSVIFVKAIQKQIRKEKRAAIQAISDKAGPAHFSELKRVELTINEIKAMKERVLTMFDNNGIPRPEVKNELEPSPELEKASSKPEFVNIFSKKTVKKTEKKSKKKASFKDPNENATEMVDKSASPGPSELRVSNEEAEVDEAHFDEEIDEPTPKGSDDDWV
eukprot:TRINITY_DN4493_c0_g1_i1.p1 TRINITY_DN4493_c0_g1~~TRINITY_DN4493_c0_g1_i1.p1  ORF type:complete len:292 (-),score=85.78 TRINITY_DN4493_c0_g1_i1:38-874(-)